MRTKILLEIVDSQDSPLGVMEEGRIHLLGLLHKRIVVLVYDKEENIYFLKKKGNKEVWIPPVCAHVGAGKGREEVALEEIEKNMGFVPRKLHPIIYPPKVFPDFCEIVSVYGAHLPPYYKIQEHEGAIEKNPFSLEEIHMLIEEAPHTLSPYLIMCWKEGVFSFFGEIFSSS